FSSRRRHTRSKRDWSSDVCSSDLTMSDRYFITAYLGMEANGIYAVANKIPAILLMMNTVFSLAWKDNAIISFNATDKNTYYSNEIGRASCRERMKSREADGT